MKIVEFRIIVPLSLENCDHSSDYACFKRSAEAKGESDSEGMEFVEAYDYEENGVKGHFTHKVMHLKSKVPAVIRWVVPDKYLHIKELSHSAFPHYLTEYEMPGMGKDFVLSTDTKHYDYKPDGKIPNNSANLTPAELKQREIRYLDILNGPIYDKSLNLKGFSYPEANIEQMQSDQKANEKNPPGWTLNYNGPMTCIIKTVKFHFKWRGIQSAVEAFVLNSVFPEVFMDNHRAMVKWAPEWSKISREELLRMEQEKQQQDKNKEFN